MIMSGTELINQVLSSTGKKKKDVAASMGITYNTFFSKMKNDTFAFKEFLCLLDNVDATLVISISNDTKIIRTKDSITAQKINSSAEGDD